MGELLLALSVLLLRCLAEAVLNTSDPFLCDGVHPVGVALNDNPRLLPAAKIVQIDANGFNTCVRFEDGLVKCSGSSKLGQHGVGKNEHRIGSVVSQLQFVPLPEPAAAISVGYAHICALLAHSKSVMCWGRGTEGQLGLGTPENVDLPVRSVELGPVKVKKVYAGGLHTCALYEDGRARCWGSNDDGQLGYPDRQRIGDDELPTAAPFVDVGGEEIVDIFVMDYASCFSTLRYSDVSCVGRNTDGALGYEHRYQSSTPAAAGDLPNSNLFRAMACAATFCMGAFASENEPLRLKNLFSWGHGFEGSAEAGDNLRKVIPSWFEDMVQKDGDGQDLIVGLFAHAARYCVLLVRENDPLDKRAVCGELISLPYSDASGDGSIVAALSSLPLYRVVGAKFGLGPVNELGLGVADTAVRDNSFYGVLIAVLPTTAVSIAVGEEHACMMDAMGVVGCAGEGNAGEALHPPISDTESGTVIASFQPDVEPWFKLGFPGQATSSILQISTGGRFTCVVAAPVSNLTLQRAFSEVQSNFVDPYFRGRPLSFAPQDASTLQNYKSRVQVQCMGSANDDRLGFRVAADAMPIVATKYRFVQGNDLETWHQLRPIDDLPAGHAFYVPRTAKRALKVTTGESFACALFEVERSSLSADRPDTVVSCWGACTFQQCGGRRGNIVGATDDDTVTDGDPTMPASDTALALAFRADSSANPSFGGLQVVDMVSGGSHTCAIHLGATKPALVMTPTGAVDPLSPQRYVRCWGSNSRDQSGISSFPISAFGSFDINLPEVPVLDAAGTPTGATRPFQPWQIALGGKTETDYLSTSAAVDSAAGHTCVLDIEGRHLACFGDNTKGQCGANVTIPVGRTFMRITATRTLALVPLPGGASKPRVKSLHAAGAATCLLMEDGRVYCWGSWASSETRQEKEHFLHVDYAGATGAAANPLIPNTAALKPVPVPAGWVTVQASLSMSHLCLLSSKGKVRCIGRTSYGRLGFFVDQTTGASWIMDAKLAKDVTLAPGPSTIAALATGGNGARHTCVLGASLATSNEDKLAADYLSASSASRYYGPLASDFAPGAPAHSASPFPFAVPPVVPEGVGYLCWGRQLSGETGRVARESIVDGLGQTIPKNFGVSHLEAFADRTSDPARPAGQLPVCFTDPTVRPEINISRCCLYERGEGQASVLLRDKSIAAIADDAFVDRADVPGRTTHISSLLVINSTLSTSAVLRLAQNVAYPDGSDIQISPLSTLDPSGTEDLGERIELRMARFQLMNVTIRPDDHPSPTARQQLEAAINRVHNLTYRALSLAEEGGPTWEGGPRGISNIVLDDVSILDPSAPAALTGDSVLPALLLLASVEAQLSLSRMRIPAFPSDLRAMIMTRAALEPPIFLNDSETYGDPGDVSEEELLRAWPINITDPVAVSSSLARVCKLSLTDVEVDGESLISIAAPMTAVRSITTEASGSIATLRNGTDRFEERCGIVLLGKVSVSAPTTAASTTPSRAIKRRGISVLEVTDSSLPSWVLFELLGRTTLHNATGTTALPTSPAPTASLALFRSSVFGPVSSMDTNTWALADSTVAYTDLRAAPPDVFCSLLSRVSPGANLTVADYLYEPRLPSFAEVAAAGAKGGSLCSLPLRPVMSPAGQGSISNVVVSGMRLVDSDTQALQQQTLLDFLCAALGTDEERGANVTVHGSRWPLDLGHFIAACGDKVGELNMLAPTAGPAMQGSDVQTTRALEAAISNFVTAADAVAFAVNSSVMVGRAADTTAQLFVKPLAAEAAGWGFPEDVALFGKLVRLKRLAMRRLPSHLRVTLSADHLFSLPDTLDSADIERLPGGICRPGQVRRTLFGISTSASQFVSACDLCPRGFVCKNGVSSEPCPKGTYSDILGASSLEQCLKCPAGTYNGASGQGRASCISCPAGSASPVEGAISASTCRVCEPGAFTSIAGSANCTLCPENTYSSLTSAVGCTPCPEGEGSSGVGTQSLLGCRTRRLTQVDGQLSAAVARLMLRPESTRGRVLASASGAVVVGFSSRDGICAFGEKPVLGSTAATGVCAPCAGAVSLSTNSSADVPFCSGLSAQPFPAPSQSTLVLTSFILGNDEAQLKQPGNVFVPVTVETKTPSSAASSNAGATQAQFGNAPSNSASSVGAAVAAAMVGIGAIPLAILILTLRRPGPTSANGDEAKPASTSASSDQLGVLANSTSCWKRLRQSKAFVLDGSGQSSRPDSSRFEGTNVLNRFAEAAPPHGPGPQGRSGGVSHACSICSTRLHELVRRLLLKVDFFGLAHQPENGKPLVRQDSPIGGSMTVLGIFTMIGLCSALLVQFSLDNRQVQTLFPLRSIYTGWGMGAPVTTSARSLAGAATDKAASPSQSSLVGSILRVTLATNTNATGGCFPLIVSGLASSTAAITTLDPQLLQIPAATGTASALASAFSCAYQFDASGILSQDSPTAALQIGAHWSVQSVGVGVGAVSAISYSAYSYAPSVGSSLSALASMLAFLLPKTSASESLAYATEAKTTTLSTGASLANQYLLEATVGATLVVDVLENRMVSAPPSADTDTTASSPSSSTTSSSSASGALTRGFRIAELAASPRYRDRSEGISLDSDMVTVALNLALDSNVVYEVWTPKLTAVQLLSGLLSFVSVFGAMRFATTSLTRGARVGKRVASLRLRSRNSDATRKADAAKERGRALPALPTASPSSSQSDSPAATTGFGQSRTSLATGGQIPSVVVQLQESGPSLGAVRQQDSETGGPPVLSASLKSLTGGFGTASALLGTSSRQNFQPTVTGGRRLTAVSSRGPAGFPPSATADATIVNPLLATNNPSHARRSLPKLTDESIGHNADDGRSATSNDDTW